MDQVEIKIGSETIVFQSGKVAKQANGAVMGIAGGTSVLATRLRIRRRIGRV